MSCFVVSCPISRRGVLFSSTVRYHPYTHRSVRNMLLDCCPPFDTEQTKEEEGYYRIEGGEECHVIAPCSHNGKWCVV